MHAVACFAHCAGSRLRPLCSIRLNATSSQLADVDQRNRRGSDVPVSTLAQPLPGVTLFPKHICARRIREWWVTPLGRAHLRRSSRLAGALVEPRHPHRPPGAILHGCFCCPSVRINVAVVLGSDRNLVIAMAMTRFRNNTGVMATACKKKRNLGVSEQM